MTHETIKTIGDAMANVASAFAEFWRQSRPSMGGAAPYHILQQSLALESARLIESDETGLGEALLAISNLIEELNDE